MGIILLGIEESSFLGKTALPSKYAFCLQFSFRFVSFRFVRFFFVITLPLVVFIPSAAQCTCTFIVRLLTTSDKVMTLRMALVFSVCGHCKTRSFHPSRGMEAARLTTEHLSPCGRWPQRSLCPLQGAASNTSVATVWPGVGSSRPAVVTEDFSEIPSGAARAATERNQKKTNAKHRKSFSKKPVENKSFSKKTVEKKGKTTKRFSREGCQLFQKWLGAFIFLKKAAPAAPQAPQAPAVLEF